MGVSVILTGGEDKPLVAGQIAPSNGQMPDSHWCGERDGFCHFLHVWPLETPVYLSLSDSRKKSGHIADDRVGPKTQTAVVHAWTIAAYPPGLFQSQAFFFLAMPTH